MLQKERFMILRCVGASQYVINPRPTAVRPWGLTRSGVPPSETAMPNMVGHSDGNGCPRTCVGALGIGSGNRPSCPTEVCIKNPGPNGAFNYELCLALRGRPNPRPTGVVD